MIRVVVADDSATARALIVEILSAEPDISVVGEARNGTEAVELAERLAPDLVTMDVQMPQLDGIGATRLIMTRSPRPILIVSSVAGTDVELSLEATRSGALMVIAKPQGVHAASHDSDRRQLVSMVRALATVKVVRRHGSPAITPLSTPLQPRRAAVRPGTTRPLGGPYDVLAIAASTGGPAALRTIFSQLDADFPLPILVVQHIAKGFTEGLAHWLAGDSPLRFRIASPGEAVRAGTVYFAPDGRHLGVRRDHLDALRVQLDDGPPVGTFRPSATHLFRSCAEQLGARVLALILTGMGDDGVAGLREVRRTGGRIMAQDEASSVIFGMPREAILAGVVDDVVSLEDVPRRLREVAP